MHEQPQKPDKKPFFAFTTQKFQSPCRDGRTR